MRVEIVGGSRALRRALQLADRFAPTPLPILLVGATGTGKELFAERIHRMSGRRGPLVPVNCAALPRDMVESLLFGHRRGAFTGAVEAAAGFVAAAEGGTLFLDEITSLSGEAQMKLLRVLETKEVHPLGETRSHRVDFRVVAAVQENVQTQLAEGTLRLDLYQRIAGVVLELPRLAERPEDIVPLARYYARLVGRVLEPGSVAVLLAYGWPGNVRELRTAIERAGFLSQNGTLAPRAVAEAIALGAPASGRSARRGPEPVSSAPNASQRDRLIAVCRHNGWDVSRAAAQLGVHKATLYRRLGMAGVSLRTLRATARLRATSRELARSNLSPGPQVPMPTGDSGMSGPAHRMP